MRHMPPQIKAELVSMRRQYTYIKPVQKPEPSLFQPVSSLDEIETRKYRTLFCKCSLTSLPRTVSC